MATDHDAAEQAFVDHMFVTAVWADARDEDGEPLDHLGLEDFAEEARQSLETDARAFYAANRDHIHCEGAPLASDHDGTPRERQAAMAGHDYWLTRNGHGAGFWDGDWPEPAGTELTYKAKLDGGVDLYIGDDGMVHV